MSLVALLTYLLLTFDFGSDGIYNHCVTRFVMFILGIVSSPVILIGCSNFKPFFNCLLPWDITLHPLTLDIRALQWIFRNCSGEKTRWSCLSLFAKFLRNSSSSSNMTALFEEAIHLWMLLCIISLWYSGHPKSCLCQNNWIHSWIGMFTFPPNCLFVLQLVICFVSYDAIWEILGWVCCFVSKMGSSSETRVKDHRYKISTHPFTPFRLLSMPKIGISASPTMDFSLCDHMTLCECLNGSLKRCLCYLIDTKMWRILFVYYCELSFLDLKHHSPLYRLCVLLQ